MSHVDNSEPNLPPAPAPAGPPPSPRRRRRRVLWIVLAVVGLLAIAVPVSASMMKVDYYALSPGSARPTEPLVMVEGAETYPSEGDVLFTTVSVDRMSRLDQLRQDWFPDPDIEVLTEEEYLGPRTVDENREFNQQLMSNSKDVAAFVALDHLGYEVAVEGTGALIVDVEPDSPAAAAGLEVGDTIVEADGTPILLSEDLVRAIGEQTPGDTVDLAVEDMDRTPREVSVTLAAREDDPSVGFLGVVSATRDLEYDLPVSVTIDSGLVGGPSAGLAFTLSVLDVLTPGELTGGDSVAVTGTINPDGTVGPVGGVAQKAAAVRDAGIDYFLVPEAEYDAAVDHAGSGVEVIAVNSLDDALDALASFGGNALALPTQQPAAAGT